MGIMISDYSTLELRGPQQPGPSSIWRNLVLEWSLGIHEARLALRPL